MSSNIVLSSSSSSSSSKFGFIKKAVPTKNHRKWLEERGYTVTEEKIGEDTYFKVEVAGFIQEASIDLDALKEMAANKWAMTYKTSAVVDGVKKTGMKLCWAMGPASALVMKTEDEVRGVKAPKAAHRFDF